MTAASSPLPVSGPTRAHNSLTHHSAPPFHVSALIILICCVCAQSQPTLCGHMDLSPPGSSARGIFQARVLQWVAMSYSKVSSQPRDQSCVSCVSCIGRQILYHVSPGKPAGILSPLSVAVEGHNEMMSVACHEIPKRILLALSVPSLLRVAATPAAIRPKLTTLE